MHIGTSGWAHRHWVGPFYAKGTSGDDLLRYYARHLASVEVNNTFYRLPSAETVHHWRRLTPKSFTFACKASRYITHMKRLNDPKESTARFFEVHRVLGDKRGPVLFQLPPRWRCNAERLRLFLDSLPPRTRYAFEFRDASWFDDTIYALLRARRAAFCIYDLAGEESPTEITADFVYVRLHGPGAAYQGNYSADVLRRWAGRIEAWRREGRDVYCYFDNDEAAYAVRNALSLRDLVGA